MKHIKTYESWRQIDAYLRVPQILIEILLKKLVNFIPRLSFMYDELSASVDLGKSLSPNIIEFDPQKLTLNDIKNKSLRNSLKVSGIFDNWNVYYVRRSIDLSNSPRVEKDVLYITKDELHKGDTYYGERISIDSDTQMYAVVAVHSEEHDEMKKERDSRYDKKKKKELEKEVKKCLKKNEFSRTSSFAGEWNHDPILFKIVRANRIDLFNKVIAAMKDRAKEYVLMKIDNEGWQTKYGGKTLLDIVKTDEMKRAIRSVIYSPEELEQLETEEAAKKYNL